MRLEIPIPTPSLTNQRCHWGKKARQAKAQRKAVWACWLATGVQPPAFPLTVTLTRIDPQEIDDDNLRGALKSIRDQVAQQLAVDDRDQRITWTYEQRRGKPRAVVVNVEPAA